MYKPPGWKRVVATLRTWFFHVLLIFTCAVQGGVPGPAHAAVVDGTANGSCCVTWLCAYDWISNDRDLAGRGADLRKDLRGAETAVPKGGMFIATRGAAEVARHHAWPKYLGGAAKQDLVTLPRNVHEAFHSGLDKILPRQWGSAYYQKLSPAAREQVLRDLSDYTRAFDSKHGTSIFDALVKEGFPAP